jgi:hypothetical protein
MVIPTSSVVHLPKLTALASDNCSYFYYDSQRYFQHERTSRLKSALEIIRNVVVTLALAFLFMTAISTMICLIKLIPYVSLLWGYIIVILIALVALGTLIISNRRTNAAQLQGALKQLIAKQAKEPLEVADYTGKAILSRLSEGQASPHDFQTLLGAVSFGLWLLVLKDLDFSSLYQFTIWNAVLLADSATLTAFNLLERVGVAPNAPGWVVFTLQVLVLATGAANIFSAQLAAYRGYKHILGNKFRARNFLRGLQQQYKLFDPEDSLTKNAIFIELDMANRLSPRLTPMTVAELERAIIEQGAGIVAEAKGHFHQPSGQFAQEFTGELQRIAAS